MNILVVKTDKPNFAVRNRWDFTSGLDFVVRVDSSDFLVDFTYWNFYNSKGDYFHVNKHRYQPLYLVSKDYNSEYMRYCSNIYWKKVSVDDMVMLFCFKGSHRFKDTMVVPVRERHGFRFLDERETDLVSRLIMNSMRWEYNVTLDDKHGNRRNYQRLVKFAVEHKLSHLL